MSYGTWCTGSRDIVWCAGNGIQAPGMRRVYIVWFTGMVYNNGIQGIGSRDWKYVIRGWY